MTEQERARTLLILMIHAAKGEQWSLYWYNRILAAQDKDAVWAEFQDDLRHSVKVINQVALTIGEWAQNASTSLVTEFAHLMRDKPVIR